MSRLAIVLILVLFLSSSEKIIAQNYLQKKVHLSASPSTTGALLDSLEKHGGFYFSYNSKLVNTEDKLQSNLTDGTVNHMLSKAFQERLSWKVVGSHIILQKRQTEKTKSTEFSIEGKVTNSKGQEIEKVIVYDVNRRQSVMSSTDGRYKLKVKSKQVDCAISYSSPGFHDTLIVIHQFSDQQVDIVLRPIAPIKEVIKVDKGAIDSLKIYPRKIDSIASPIQDVGLVNVLVPKEALFVSQHLNVFETRPLQVSFLPFIGSNFRSAGVIRNRLSLNILAGYSAGVNGIELGGLANISKGDVVGIQVAGLSNVVGGNVYGVQLGGLANLNMLNTYGFQIAGLVNANMGRTEGLQMAGLTNFNLYSTSGFQIGGLINSVVGEFSGFQLAGLVNLANMKKKDSSSVLNTQKSAQFQLAGLANVGREVNGVQLAGLININLDTLSGVQFSGIYNQTKVLNGVQVGLINYVDSIGHGASFGLINIIRNGYRSFQLSTNETFPVNVTVKSGGQHFYTFAKISSGAYYGAGLGVGLTSNAKRRVSGYLDISSQTLLGEELDGVQFLGNLYSVHSGLQLRLFRGIGISVGPTMNALSINADAVYQPLDKPSPNPYFGETAIADALQGENKPWIGWNASLNFKF